ncbi:hypothetical protein [Sorangium sp. So ce131]|uniref:hypothetical protein n=1 Tax=Sorangium sp. So ce131 TaxID=3133282 RepID=UPI003F5D625E
MAEPIDAPSPIWFKKLPQTPALSETGDELGFALVPGRGRLGPTVVLAGAYRVTPPLLDYYGGQLPRPIRVVAVDTARGAIFSTQLLQEKSPPVVVMVPEGAPPSGGGRAQGGSFNVDLAAQLGLPPHAATYHVFLWLDHVLSPVDVLQLAEDPQRVATSVSGRRPADLVRFGAAPAIAPDPQAVILRADPTAPSRGVEGAWVPDPARLKDHERPYFLTVLAFGHRDRSFGWASVNVNTLPQGADAAHFHVDAAALAGASQQAQKVFAVAFAEGKRIQVLTLPAR